MRLSSRQQLWALLAFAYVARLFTLGGYPLTDTTEARYAEIARKMLETGQWIMPQIDYDVPFWGKPPLSFWLTAISYRLVGVSEFAARIPSLLLSLAICALVYVLGSRRHGVDYGLRASVVVATSLLMMVVTGGVMTDPAMVLGTTLSMVAFWLAVTTASSLWGYLFFVGLAIGLLAKGPVAMVLTLLPIAAWVMMTRRVRVSWQNLPWAGGMALTAALVVPWYWAAELHSPGYLHYFLVGEHWERYTVSGWNGDLYGSGHAYPRGTIWLYALLGTLPWSPWLLWQVLRRKVHLAIRPLRSNDGWLPYLLCWMFAPIVFFTMSRNILPTYVLPGLMGFGLLVAEAWQQRSDQGASTRVQGLAVLTPALVLLLVMVVWPRVGFQSHRDLVMAYRDASAVDVPLVYFGQRQYSAEFYSQGKARQVSDVGQLRQVLAGPGPVYIATDRSTFEKLPADLRTALTPVTKAVRDRYLLLRYAREPVSNSD